MKNISKFIGLVTLFAGVIVLAQVNTNNGPSPAGTGGNGTLTTVNPQKRVLELINWVDNSGHLNGVDYTTLSNWTIQGSITAAGEVYANNGLSVPQPQTGVYTNDAWAGSVRMITIANTTTNALIAQTNISASDLIFLSVQTINPINAISVGIGSNSGPYIVIVTNLTPNVGFQISTVGTNVASTNQVNWFIIRHN